MPDPEPPLLDIQIALPSWRQVPKLRARLQQAARATQEHLPKKLRFPFAATVLLTGNAKVRQLNRNWRGMDKPTNVLSFPQFDPAQLPKLGKSGTCVEIGDIAIAYQYVVAESKKEHKILINHVTHLVIHGLLHLFGYDHIIDKEADTMEKMETTIMQSLGLPAPYDSKE
ncbi:MAG: rRNA maturation RNase YbeY [Alphaproteobacteria bacterium]|nr:rRNA maturation RNase YbeY [Alphaproteobacteria bacterium]